LILVVLLLPVLGLILWYFLGPRDGKSWRCQGATEFFAQLRLSLQHEGYAFFGHDLECFHHGPSLLRHCKSLQHGFLFAAKLSS